MDEQQTFGAWAASLLKWQLERCLNDIYISQIFLLIQVSCNHKWSLHMKILHICIFTVTNFCHLFFLKDKLLQSRAARIVTNSSYDALAECLIE